MDEALIQLVWDRAGSACEYCLMPQIFFPAAFQIDHIIARQHGGGVRLTEPGSFLYPLERADMMPPMIRGLDHGFVTPPLQYCCHSSPFSAST
jgi:hypothetical protein